MLLDFADFVKLLEDLILVGLGDADAGIDDREFDIGELFLAQFAGTAGAVLGELLGEPSYNFV